MNEQQPKRAIVLSGGGGRGAFELGVMEHLESVGWTPNILIGTSIGSMNSAVYALGGIKRLQDMWENIRTRDMHRFFRLRPWNSLFDRTPWQQTLEKFTPSAELAQLNTPLYIVATDITTGHPVIYTNGDKPDKDKPPYQKVDQIAHSHLLASSSIPYVYAKTPIGDAEHWDGAVMYNSPLRPAIDAGAEEIMIVLLSPYHKAGTSDQPAPVQQGGTLPPAPRSIAGAIGYVLDMALIGTFENDFEQLRKINRRVHFGLDPVSDHKEIKCAIIAPEDWITPLDIIRYRKDRIRALRSDGHQAARQTWQRIQKQGWDSLQNL